MKTNRTINLILTATTFILVSCEKVIELELRDEDKKVVVEGYISNDSTRNFVKLSMSGNFYQKTGFESIAGAIVTLNDESGTSYTVTELSGGIYSYNDLMPTAGKKYNLTIQADKKIITSENYFPSFTPIDSLSYEFQKATGFSDEGFSVSCHFKDKGDEVNYYRFKLYKNDSLFDDLFYMNDQFNDGIAGRYAFWQKAFQLTDTIKVDMISIDKATFNYLNGVNEIGGGNGESAAPGNPATNLKGDALGIFSTYNVDTKFIIIK